MFVIKRYFIITWITIKRDNMIGKVKAKGI